MSELLPSILSAIKVELQTMNRSLSQIMKTHATLLSEQWVTKDQVMALLKICSRSVDTLKSTGTLSYSKIKGLVYFKVNDVEKLLNENYVTNTPDNHSSFKSPSNVSKS